MVRADRRAGLKRSLNLKPGQVTAVKFRIRAKQVGHSPLTVKATGTKMSDAVKRTIDVVARRHSASSRSSPIG